MGRLETDIMEQSMAAPKLPAEINSATRYVADFLSPFWSRIVQIPEDDVLTESYSSLHTHLNALITSRLPLVLPPHAESPLVYATGLIPFARVYLAFEAAWEKACIQGLVRELRQQSAGSSFGSGVFDVKEDIWVDVPLELLAQSSDLGESVENDEYDDSDDESRDTTTYRYHHQPASASSVDSSIGSLPPLPDSPLTRSTVSAAPVASQAITLLRAIRNLRPANMARSSRLKSDLAALLAISPAEVSELLAKSASPDHPLFSPATESFISHINASTLENPHVLAAYAYVLYMAIFSGGRWIRSVLSSAGNSFWLAEHTKIGEALPSIYDEEPVSASKSNTILLSPTPAIQKRLEKSGLSLWFFKSPTDGLDIKAEFKARLDGLEDLLTKEQRNDIVEEARIIFERCESLVADLDERVGRQGKFVEIERPEPVKQVAEQKESKVTLVQKQAADSAARIKVVISGLQDASMIAGWFLLSGCAIWYALQMRIA
jgi:hypothetical protein